METVNTNLLCKRLLTFIAIVIIFFGCIYAGRADFNDYVLSGMSESKFKFIQQSIGGGSPSEVVREYLSRQSYYDSVDTTYR